MNTPEWYTAGKGESQRLPLVPLESVTLLLMGATGRSATSAMMRGKIPQDTKNPIWVVNHAARVYSHNLAWNTHDLNKLKDVETEINFESFYREYDRPVVTLRPVAGIKTLIYPIKEVIEHWQDDYFFAAPAYMLAYAGMCGVERIRIFGADFDYADRSEYEAGRCCLEYWMGRLRSRGVTFELPAETTLLDFRWRTKNESRPVNGHSYGAIYGYFDKQPQVSVDADGKMKVEE